MYYLLVKCMRKENILYVMCLMGIGLLAGCSAQEKNDVAYNWDAPIENVNWGQKKEEVFEEIGIEEDSVECLSAGESNSIEMYVLVEPISFLGEDAQTTLSFDPTYGLVRITFSFEEVNAITNLAPKIQEEYSSETGSTQTRIYGSIPNEMEASDLQKYKSYLKDQGMDEAQIEASCSSPLVIIDYDLDENSPFYNTCNFNASRAALWEYAMG